MVFRLNLGGVDRLTRDLNTAPGRTTKQTRGILAKTLDEAESTAQRNALATWSTYGRGMQGTAGTIRARMSNSEETVGYLFADGPGARMQEYGTGHHPPQPVMREAVTQAVDGAGRRLGQVSVL